MAAAGKMPAVFVGHGSPMNAITETPYTRAWEALGAALPRPRAILFVSAHWYIRGSAVTAMERPPTIHDFGAFPKALFDVEYPAPGDPKLATEVAEMLAPTPVRLDTSWGLDHGVWSVLVHVYPNADIPVVELSVDADASPHGHFDLGRRLAPLRDRGVLVMASGNIVHNLQYMDLSGKRAPYDWAVRFDERIREALEKRNDEDLINYENLPDAALAAPDVEHYVPMLYIAGVRGPDDHLRFIIDGIDGGAVSMRAFQVG
jgi:4,5-DOPA dioxygenase extradiol